MSKHESESSSTPPTETEKFQTVARLISRRLEELYTTPAESFTAVERRELTILEELNQTWVKEGPK